MSGTISQGTLNRVRASVTIPLFPTLNITSAFLGKRGVSVSRTGKATTFSDTMTGRVTSPEPYVDVLITIHLLKSQFLSNAWAQQELISTLIGDIIVRPDAATLQPYYYSNCAIESAGNTLDFSGADADFPLEIGGAYLMNAFLFT
jgi:hypothetical protein